jgi:phosphohistidine phosphatase
MKTLFINRHAKSSWSHEGLSDFERPLNKRGKNDAPIMGKRLKDNDEGIELMVSSPAVRALSTAKIMAGEIGYKEDDIKEIPEIYAAGVEQLLSIINALDDDYDKVIMFGHNPGFTNLVDYFTGAGLLNVPTCGIAKITFMTDHWKELSAHTGKLAYFDFPKNTD